MRVCAPHHPGSLPRGGPITQPGWPHPPVTSSAQPARTLGSQAPPQPPPPPPARLSYEARAALAQNPLARRCLELMARKHTNLSVAADVDTAKEMLELADKVRESREAGPTLLQSASISSCARTFLRPPCLFVIPE